MSEAEPPEPRVRHFEASTGDLTLAADEWGIAGNPSVVLIHGGGQTRHAWQSTAQRLALNDLHVISMDMRGHGESGWARDGNYSFTAFCGDVRAVARALPTHPVLVGASLGGISSLLAVGETEEKLASALVLVDIATRTQRSGADKILGFMRARPDGFESLEEAANVVAAYLPHRKRPSDPSGLAKNLRKHADGRYRWHWDPEFARMRGDFDDRSKYPERLDAAARSLTLPTLLVRGKLSDLLSEAGARLFLSQAPHARYVDVSEAGHMVAGDKNEIFTDAVCSFIDELR